MSKGSNRRKEDLDRIWNNWDAIFGSSKVKELTEPKPEPNQDDQKDNAK